MYRSKNKGFTLIEIIMVMAISALLAVALLGSYNNTQKRTRFTDAMERISAEFEQLKTEVNSSFTTGSGTNSGRIFFGKEIRLTQGDGSFTVNNLTAARTDEGTLSLIETTPERTYAFPWGITLVQNGGNNKVVFTRNPANGLLNTYVLPRAAADPNSNPLNAGSYNSTTEATEAVLVFDSPEGYTARIRINLPKNEIRLIYVD